MRAIKLIMTYKLTMRGPVNRAPLNIYINIQISLSLSLYVYIYNIKIYIQLSRGRGRLLVLLLGLLGAAPADSLYERLVEYC